MATDTWFTTDLPVLDAAVELFSSGPLNAAEIAETTGLDVARVGVALSRLNGEYVEVLEDMDGWEAAVVFAIHPAARRAVGQWPSPEVLAQRIVSQLDRAADQEPDPAKKSKLRALAKAAGEVGTKALGGIIAAAATYGLGAG